MKSPFDAHRFATLDWLRGVAAFAVVFRHFSMGSNIYALPLSFLAVDFFFILSGFVLEPTFTTRGEPVPWALYMWKRVLRLWPTYLFGLVFAVIGISLNSHWTFPSPIREAVGALLLLPIVGKVSPDAIFPWLGPAWSLFAEFWIANLSFAILYPRLPRKVFYVGMGLLVIVMCWITIRQGSVDFGYTWRRWPEAIPRVLFSFGVGCALRQLRRQHEKSLGGLWLFLLSLGLIGVFAIPIEGMSRWLSVPIQLTALILILPAIVFAASFVSLGPKARWIAERSGELSYPLYVLHFGLGKIASWAWHPVETWAPFVTFAVALLFLPIAWLVSYLFETPVRKFVKKMS